MGGNGGNATAAAGAEAAGWAGAKRLALARLFAKKGRDGVVGAEEDGSEVEAECSNDGDMDARACMVKPSLPAVEPRTPASPEAPALAPLCPSAPADPNWDADDGMKDAPDDDGGDDGRTFRSIGRDDGVSRSPLLSSSVASSTITREAAAGACCSAVCEDEEIDDDNGCEDEEVAEDEEAEEEETNDDDMREDGGRFVRGGDGTMMPVGAVVAAAAADLGTATS